MIDRPATSDVDAHQAASVAAAHAELREVTDQVLEGGQMTTLSPVMMSTTSSRPQRHTQRRA